MRRNELGRGRQPVGVHPLGTDSAGWPVRFSGAVLKQSRADVRPETSANVASPVTSFGAVSGSVGVSSTS